MYVKNGFAESRPDQLIDFNGNSYKVAYNRNVAEILEPMPLTVQKGDCDGMYLCVDSASEKGIEEIVYEKVYAGI